MAKKDLSGKVNKVATRTQKKTGDINSLNVAELKISDIDPHENNLFAVEEDAKFKALVQSIKDRGVIEPIIVIKIEVDGKTHYKLVSGHRRTKAAKMAGQTVIPARIKTYNDENDQMAALIDANMTQRNISIEDTYRVIEFWYNYAKSKKISGRKEEWVGNKIGISYRQVYRYLYIAKISENLKQLIYNGKIPLNSVDYLKNLDEDTQEEVYKKYVVALDEAVQELKKSAMTYNEYIVNLIENLLSADNLDASTEESLETDLEGYGIQKEQIEALKEDILNVSLSAKQCKQIYKSVVGEDETDIKDGGDTKTEGDTNNSGKHDFTALENSNSGSEDSSDTFDFNALNGGGEPEEEISTTPEKKEKGAVVVNTTYIRNFEDRLKTICSVPKDELSSSGLTVNKLKDFLQQLQDTIERLENE